MKRMHGVACFLLTLCAQGAAAQADCDPATYDNTCSGGLLTFCGAASETTQTFDCAQFWGTTRSNTTCGPAFGCIDNGTSGACTTAADEYCVGATEGSWCLFLTGAETDPVQLCAPGYGCVLEDDGGALVENCHATASCGLLETSKGCVGDVATLCLSGKDAAGADYTLSDAMGVDCGAFGSTCSETNDGPVCEGQAGAACLDEVRYPDSLYRCATGFQCITENPDALGVCEPLPTTGGGAERCGQVDALGVCDPAAQDDAIWCPSGDPEGDLARLPCAAFELNDGSTQAGSCDVFEGFGAWCVFETGTACVFAAGEDLLPFACGDDTGFATESACSVESGCVDDVGSCSESPAAPLCVGDGLLAFECSAFGQYIGFDCTSADNGGGTCDQTTNTCAVGAGASCRSDSLFRCGEGLECVGEDLSSGDFGTCVLVSGLPGPDAGTEVDAGVTPDAGGAVDAGGTPDAGGAVDAGGTPDAGGEVDAGGAPDAGGAVDAGTNADADAGLDAGADSDAGAKVDDDDEPEPTVDEGCDCTAARPLDVAGAGLFALMLLRPRHRRRR